MSAEKVMEILNTAAAVCLEHPVGEDGDTHSAT